VSNVLVSPSDLVVRAAPSAPLRFGDPTVRKGAGGR
jgi:hypothetical protein